VHLTLWRPSKFLAITGERPRLKAISELGIRLLFPVHVVLRLCWESDCTSPLYLSITRDLCGFPNLRIHVVRIGKPRRFLALI